MFKLYNLMFDICIYLWNHHYNQDNDRIITSKSFHISLGNSFPLHPSLSLPHLLKAITDTLSVTIDYFLFFRVLCKCSHILFTLFLLASFIHQNYVHPSFISLYYNQSFLGFLAWIYHNLLIHSLIYILWGFSWVFGSYK